MAKSRLFIFAILLIILSMTGYARTRSEQNSCRHCHAKIEDVSTVHNSCTSCHGGNPQAMDKKDAHRGMAGQNNPSVPEAWLKSCGTCHYSQVVRMKSALMYTNAGMIRNIKLTWEGQDNKQHAVTREESFAGDGKPLLLEDVDRLDNLAGELYRKFCSHCHVGVENSDADGSGHPAGCAACHFPYNDTETYQGRDQTVRDKGPYSATHRMEALPPMAACVRCHNRSGRVALSFQGFYEGNNGLVPTRGGLPGPVRFSDGRNAVHIAPDVHYQAGMECIDCHTSREIMGDGYAYATMDRQVEISCADCHGGLSSLKWHEIRRENEPALQESRSYRLPARNGMRMLLTAKGRPYANVFLVDGNVVVQGKRSGKFFKSPLITGTPEHTIKGHGRLECFACHSRTVVQCYGCHTRYDKRVPSMDYVRGEETPGRFSETEDYRTLYPFPLAVNQRGRISPVTPGCQTFVTVVETDGSLSKNEYVARYKGKPQLRFAPFYSHNTGKKAIGCGECHGNPAFLGFGQHVVEGADIQGTLICDQSETKPLDGFVTLKSGTVRAYAAITRERSRPFNGAEVKRVMAVNLCLVCHGRAQDPIYRKELDYRALDDRLHRNLLSDR